MFFFFLLLNGLKKEKSPCSHARRSGSLFPSLSAMNSRPAFLCLALTRRGQIQFERVKNLKKQTHPAGVALGEDVLEVGDLGDEALGSGSSSGGRRNRSRCVDFGGADLFLRGDCPSEGRGGAPLAARDGRGRQRATSTGSGAALERLAGQHRRGEGSLFFCFFVGEVFQRKKGAREGGGNQSWNCEYRKSYLS